MADDHLFSSQHEASNYRYPVADKSIANLPLVNPTLVAKTSQDSSETAFAANEYSPQAFSYYEIKNPNGIGYQDGEEDDRGNLDDQNGEITHSNDLSFNGLMYVDA
ncbi:MAG: hypothetical protein Q9190_005446 [Brigantiaea leucoxantha]